MRRLHPGERNLTFFGTSYVDWRHNRLIANLWEPGKFIWVRQGFVLPRLGALYDHDWSVRLFRVLRRFLAWYVPNAACYYWVDDLVSATPRPAWLAPDHPFNARYESRYYPLIAASPAPALRLGEPLRSSVARVLNDRFGSDFPRRATLYIRGARGGPIGADGSSVNRVSSDLDAHLAAIALLNRAGYQVLLTGDVIAPAEMIAGMAGGLVDWRAAGLRRDAFGLFAGVEVDIHIGSLSGGSAYVFVTDIPALMLNAFPPGDALPRTTVSYKWLYEDDGEGKLVQLPDMLRGRFYDHQLHGCRLLDNSPDEMAEIVADFIAHMGERPYGVDPAVLGIEAPWIRAADGRLSPAWLRQYRGRSSARVLATAQQ
jgi:putative glycosyltransferase (TIGR04372 family)